MEQSNLLYVQDDDAEKVTAKTAKLGKTHKCTRSAGTATIVLAECRNSCRVSAGEGMNSMATSMDSVRKTLADAMCEVATTMCLANINSRHGTADVNPDIHVAIALIKSNEELSENEFGDAAQCITNNPTITTVYVSMSSRSLHSRYIHNQVNNLRSFDLKVS